jgi:hypothetical protein
MVEQEQLSGMGLLMVQQHLLIIFALWNTAEPNQYNGAQENYAHITAPGVGITGSWNDLTLGILPEIINPRYIVEYVGNVCFKNSGYTITIQK